MRQYSTIKDGIKNSCDNQQNHVLPKLCGAGGHQTGMDIQMVDYNVTCSIFTGGKWVQRYFFCTVNPK